MAENTGLKTIYLAGGCFWGVEKYLWQIPGVAYTSVGYANGRTENPTYEEVCHANTGHAETVKVTYDPTKITLGFLLSTFFKVIDPTSVNKQGNDKGVQYRTGIYYTDPADLPVIQAAIATLQKRCIRKVAIQVEPLNNYYEAEDYHQKYLSKNPGGYCHIGDGAFKRAAKAVDPAFARTPNFIK